MKNKNTMAKRCVSLALATVMALSLAGCKAGGNDAPQPGSGTTGQTQAGGSAAGEKIVNIGVTNTLNTLNPLLMDGMEMNKYATGLMFLPLMELDGDINFEGMLADSVTAEDDRNFLVHIDDKAVWSDGQPVTADDVVYTALRICSPTIGNMAMMYYVFEGVGDDGFVAEGADHVEGITKVDDKTVRFTTKAPMSLITFNSSYARYLMTLPKHVIENMSEQELMSDPWFNRPDVVSITDARVRQAMVYAIDRGQILEQLLKGYGEVSEGFLSSASPYFDDTITPLPYDPEKAKSLLEESGWDRNRTIKFSINSDDSTFVNAASVIAAQWASVGIKAEIQTMDINTLMANAAKGDFDVMAIQYTYPPVDPYADVAWLLGGEGSWTGYGNDKINEALSKVSLTDDVGQLKELYSIVDRQVQEDVPMFSAYIIKTMAGVNKRLVGARPSVYGFLNHVEQWDIAQ